MYLHRKIIDANKPDGSVWNVEEDSDLDHLEDGIGDSLDEDKAIIETLADIRNPQKTQQLEDLEKEFGLQSTISMTEQERRDILSSEKTDNNNKPTHELLQQTLRKRGFNDIFVYPNNPPVDPRIFLNDIWGTHCDSGSAFCDHEDAVCGGQNPQDDALVVNGVFNITGSDDHIMACDSELAFCDGISAYCGQNENPQGEVIEIYQVPDESGYWGLIFFVGGVAETEDIDFLVDESGNFLVDESGRFLVSSRGELLSIESFAIESSRREELQREILKYKPLFSWCVLVVNYI